MLPIETCLLVFIILVHVVGLCEICDIYHSQRVHTHTGRGLLSKTYREMVGVKDRNSTVSD